MTLKAAAPGTLVVWPEGSIPAYLPADLGSAQMRPVFPALAQ